MFKEYKSKPITRLAMVITVEHDVLYREEKSEATVQTATGA